MTRRTVALVALSLWGCAPPEQLALTDTRAFVQQNLDALVTSATALCAAAPSQPWSTTTAPAAVATMRAEWKKTRVAYEHVEGAIAVLFPELDVSTDERYDGFLETMSDANLFDGEGVTGVHALERILFSDAIAPEVVRFEEGLGSRYVAAAFPSTADEARAFKDGLCARLVADVTKLRDDFRPVALDTASAFRGVIGSMEEQLEKATFAATGEEESRYARFTLGDMRANLEGATQTYAAFRPWLQAKGEAALDAEILAGLARVKAGYDALEGDALPAPPATWSSISPSEADRQTDFGRLFTLIEAETQLEGASLVASMRRAATVLGIPELPES